MSLLSSSTSSSDRPLRELARVGLSTLVVLATFDVGLSLWLGDAPTGPSASSGALERYFEYGRSVEGKIRCMVGPTDAATHPLALAGWIEPPADQPSALPEGRDLLVAVYGMSFSAKAANAMREQDPTLEVRNAGGPGATLGHSYAMYQRDRGQHAARVVVLGILASSFASLSTVTHATWNFESPSPHFYPRFTLDDGRLRASAPPIASLDELRSVLADDARLDAALDAIARDDAFYDPFVFRESALDRSAIARTLRRAWGQRVKRDTIARFHNASGFTNESEALDVARAIVRDFTTQVRADGLLPVLLVINDQGYRDHLFRALLPVIDEMGLDYVSTHAIAPATDPSNFVSDGHFTRANDLAIGRALGAAIQAGLARPPP